MIGLRSAPALLRDIVEEVENPHTQVSLEDAQKVRKSYKVGQRMATVLKTKEFGRIAAQTAKHVIRQGLREGERNLQCSEMQSRAHELITATVVSIDPERGNIVLDLGKGGSAVLPRNEQVPGETFREGETVQVYVVDVLATDRGPRVTISRTHPGLVKRMFELEVPEIYDGTVEIKAIAREAGARTKLAVWSKNPDVDPVGACIGARGARVEKIVQELGGEKIDVIRWSEDVTEFISAALSPAKVVKVDLLPGEGQELPCHGARPPAQPGHRQQGAERPPVRPPDRLQHRHPPGVRLLRRGRGVKPAEQPLHRAAPPARTLCGKEVGYLQQQKQKKIPMRRCVGCNAQRPKRELVRVVRSPEGVISIDLRGKAPGRGAYLCPSAACLARARKAKAAGAHV